MVRRCVRLFSVIGFAALVGVAGGFAVFRDQSVVDGAGSWRSRARRLNVSRPSGHNGWGCQTYRVTYWTSEYQTVLAGSFVGWAFRVRRTALVAAASPGGRGDMGDLARDAAHEKSAASRWRQPMPPRALSVSLVHGGRKGDRVETEKGA